MANINFMTGILRVVKIEFLDDGVRCEATLAPEQDAKGSVVTFSDRERCGDINLGDRYVGTYTPYDYTAPQWNLIPNGE